MDLFIQWLFIKYYELGTLLGTRATSGDKGTWSWPHGAYKPVKEPDIW